MRTKSLFLTLGALALGMAVSCQEKETVEPAVKIISGATAEIEATGGEHTVTFTSTTGWELRDIEKFEWIAADKENGKGSSNEQTITLQISPNAETDRSASLTIYASPLAKKTITITQKGVQGDGITIAKFLELKDATNAYKLTGQIGDISTGTKYYGFTLKDETGEISCPFPSNWTEFSSKLHTGDKVSISGTYKFYSIKSQDQVKNGKIESHEPADLSSIKENTVDKILESKDRFNMYRYTGTVGGTINTTYCSFDLTDASGQTIKVYSVNNASEWGSKIKVGGTVKLYGAYTLYTNSSTGASTPELVDVTIESFTEGGGDTPTPDKVTVEGLAVAVHQNGFLVSTASDGIKYVYEANKTHVVKVGDNVKVTGVETTYQNVPEITTYEVEVISSGNTVTYPEATAVSDANVGDLALFTYVKASGNLVHSGKFYNLTIDGLTTKTGSNTYPTGIDDATYNKKNVDIEGYYVGLTVTNGAYFNIAYTKIALSAVQPEPEPEAPAGSITLTFPDDNKASNAVSGYTVNWTAKTGDTEFAIVNFNNNKWNNNWAWIKCGSENAASVASISTKAAQTTVFDKVVLNFDSYSSVNSAKLYVASDSEFSADLQTIEMVYSSTDKTGTFTIPTPAANRYYKVEFDCQKATSSNGPVSLTKLVLWASTK